ncbi:MAG TPA: hypothetical protein VFX94_01150 [Burkholderiales bacterium]|nr:hypothetical protein [Burkholderiales bacterium]
MSLGQGKALRRSSTGLALLIQLEGESRWIPISQLHDDSEVYQPGHEGNVIVLEWWADKEGLSDVKTKGKDPWKR